jgi:hypothetical protein
VSPGRTWYVGRLPLVDAVTATASRPITTGMAA